MNLRLLMVFFYTILSFTVAYAQQSLTGDITLRDAIYAAMASNPQLMSFDLREDSLLGVRETAELKPPLTFNTGIENAIGTGDLSGLSGTELTLSLSSVLEMEDIRSARVGVVNSRLQLLESEQRVTELDLMSEVAFRFIDVAAAQERGALQIRATEIAEQTLALLEPLVNAGQSPQMELARANAALIRARTAERFAAASLESSRIKLSSMWVSQNPEFSTVNSDFYSVGEAGSLTSILLSLENNPYIEIFASEQRLLDAQLRQARSQIQRNIQWTAGIRHLREIDDTGLVFNISVPLFSNERASGSVRTARANLAEVDARKEVALNNIRGQLYSLQQQLDQAIFEVNTLQQDVLPLLTTVLTQTRDAYEGGRYSYIEIISAQQEYLDAELSLINSAANAHTLRAEIERLSGMPF